MPTTTPLAADSLPEGEFAIVEALGHRTLVGRVAEIERFGTKMLQVEPFFGDVMLAPVLLGGGSIYQFTPCSAQTAYAHRPQQTYQLPPSIAATVPPTALPSNEELPSFLCEDDEYDDRHGVDPVRDPIEVTKLEGAESVRSWIRPIGRVSLNTARGVIVADEVPGLSTMLVGYEGEQTVAVLTYCSAHGVGTFAQIDADLARKFGASLIHLANLLDGKVH